MQMLVDEGNKTMKKLRYWLDSAAHLSDGLDPRQAMGRTPLVINGVIRVPKPFLLPILEDLSWMQSAIGCSQQHRGLHICDSLESMAHRLQSLPQPQL